MAAENVMTHAGLEKHILEEHVHSNRFEHRQSLTRFLVNFFVYAFLGILLGGLIDRVVAKVRGDLNSKWRCLSALSAQLAVTGTAFYILVKLSETQNLNFLFGLMFDDWMMGTWQGFIFALTFFGTQQSLTDNIQCVVQDFL